MRRRRQGAGCSSRIQNGEGKCCLNGSIVSAHGLPRADIQGLALIRVAAVPFSNERFGGEFAWGEEGELVVIFEDLLYK